MINQIVKDGRGNGRKVYAYLNLNVFARLEIPSMVWKRSCSKFVRQAGQRITVGYECVSCILIRALVKRLGFINRHTLGFVAQSTTLE